MEWSEDAKRITALRDKLENAMLNADEVYVNGDRINRLPTVSNLSFRFIDGQVLLTSLNKQLAVSSGAACSSASIEPSHVLKAMKLGDETAMHRLGLVLTVYDRRRN